MTWHLLIRVFLSKTLLSLSAIKFRFTSRMVRHDDLGGRFLATVISICGPGQAQINLWQHADLSTSAPNGHPSQQQAHLPVALGNLILHHGLTRHCKAGGRPHGNRKKNTGWLLLSSINYDGCWYMENWPFSSFLLDDFMKTTGTQRRVWSQIAHDVYHDQGGKWGKIARGPTRVVPYPHGWYGGAWIEIEDFDSFASQGNAHNVSKTYHCPDRSVGCIRCLKMIGAAEKQKLADICFIWKYHSVKVISIWLIQS